MKTNTPARHDRITMKALLLSGAMLLATTHAASAQTITSPTGTVTVASADDYATRVLQDPWDMNQRTDLGWFTFGADSPPNNLSNFSFANGIFSATPTADDSNFWLLDTPLPGTVENAKDGKNFPIDGSKYKLLLIRMSLAQDASQSGRQFGQVFWSNNTIYNGQRATGTFPTHQGWWIYAVDLSTLGGSPAWPGPSPSTVDSLRFDPTQTMASGQIQVDWARLVDNSNAALSKTISWTGGASSYNIFLSNSSNCANASEIVGNQRSGYSLYVGGLPAGDWYVGLGTGASPTTCSTGFFRVAGVPTMSFASPSEEGSSDDFATMQLGNPWDFDSVQDVDYFNNITGLGTSLVAAETEGGTALGSIRVLSGTSIPALPQNVGDPYLYPLWWTLRGATHRIDTSRYRILTFEMTIPRIRDLANGSIARVVWKVAGESSENVTTEIILHHLDPATNNGLVAMQTITLDMADRTKVPLVSDPSLSSSGWVGTLDSFRVDPHEFSNPTVFDLRRVKLAAFERANTSYTINVWYNNPAGTAATLSFFDDTDQAGFNGSAIAGCQNLTPSASTTCAWNTSGLASGSLHYIYAVVSSGSTVINQTYARWPIVIDHTNTANTVLSVDRYNLNFAAVPGVAGTPSQQVTLTQSPGAALNWTATITGDDPSWFVLSRTSGSGPGQITVSLNPNANLVPGWNNRVDRLIITAPGASNSPEVDLLLSTFANGSTSGPFGFLDTPVDGSTVSGAIGVTGWALDDVGVANVGVYRNCVTTLDNPQSCQIVNGNNVVFISNGSFVVGARPDVEGAYATYPLAERAGWGIQVLTNMLPNTSGAPSATGGQGTMTLYVYATDVDGHQVLLGQKVINVDNAHASRPFGTIDTPTPGATLSGTIFNFGWALTPGSAMIPTDGHTMQVVIDGVAVGTVNYNQCRAGSNSRPPVGTCQDDIATLFPSESNITGGSGAIGVISIDTTTLANGLHTLAWGVTDNQNRTDGLGSRFFNVLNGSSSLTAALAASDAPATVLGAAETVTSRPLSNEVVWGRVGFDMNAPWEVLTPDDAGMRYARLTEFGRLELSLGAGVTTGYLQANGTLRPLPPGSQLDSTTGAFTWAPGPGYIGGYDLVFQQAESQIPMHVTIVPKVADSAGQLRGAIDLPIANAIVSGPFTVAGWALDLDAWQGAGIGAVHVWAQRRDAPAAPVFLGAAELGGSRPDVATAFGAQFDRTGWTLTASGLAPGTYDVTAYFWNTRTGGFDDARTVTITTR